RRGEAGSKAGCEGGAEVGREEEARQAESDVVSDQLRAELTRIAADLGAPEAVFILERPRDEGHGDWATTHAMALAKTLKRKPRDHAEEIVGKLALSSADPATTEIA